MLQQIVVCSSSKVKTHCTDSEVNMTGILVYHTQLLCGILLKGDVLGPSIVEILERLMGDSESDLVHYMYSISVDCNDCTTCMSACT